MPLNSYQSVHNRAHLSYSIPCLSSLLALLLNLIQSSKCTLFFLSFSLCMCCFLYLRFSVISWLILHLDGTSLVKASLYKKFRLEPFSTCAKIACFSLSCISPIQYLGHTYTKNIHCLSEIKLNWKLILCLANLTCTHIICYITIVILFLCYSRVSFHKL